MMKIRIIIVLALLVTGLILNSCKKEDANYYETGIPAFAVYQKDGESEAFYGYCASHDILLDSIYITSPINIKSKRYYHGTPYVRENHFLIGDDFVFQEGSWTMVFYGRKQVNGFSFVSHYENTF